MAKIFLALCFVLRDVVTASSEMATPDILQKLEALEKGMHALQLENHKIQLQHEKVTSENVRINDEYIKLKAGIEEGRRLASDERRLQIADLQGAMDHMWLLICGAMVMLMQAGFAMVESGCCRIKNVQNILLKNLVDVCMGTLCWYAWGYMYAYGFDEENPKDRFAGTKFYFGHEFLEADDDGNQTPTGHPLNWFFQWAFCATASTIVSGGVAERVQFPAYIVYTFFMTSFIYPVVVAWCWSSNGWLTPKGSEDAKGHLNEVGFNDFAGSGIVHMTGGVGALVGAIISGPRKGRFDIPQKESFDPHNLPLVVLGTFILWFGWYGFNCGSTLGLSTTAVGQLAAIVAMNTTIAASSGGLMVLVLRFIMTRKYDIAGMCNGILGGLVSITAGCGNVESGSALLIGLIGGVVFQGASGLLQKLKIDDPIDAFAVHGACGAWGVLAACLFDWGKGLEKYNGFGGGLENAKDDSGNTDNLWKSGFAAAIVEILVITAWVGGLSFIILLPFKVLGFLRVDDQTQDRGLDDAKHSPPKAYSGRPAATSSDGVGHVPTDSTQSGSSSLPDYNEATKVIAPVATK
mmetsp:Transcript_33904/g.62819  ORF Transcript_33904/g.62819 Transcript_33904/m.62819 type:complete len:577 (-) Transcript_33904:194-1924(-)